MDDFERKLSELHDRVIGNALSDEERANYSESLFDSIKHKNKSGEEFWYARELQIALEYTEWRNFSKVIERAKTSCQNSGNTISDHFVEFNKIVKAGATTKKIVDIELSRYACYLIVQNGDSRKKVIALGQTYFAVKTRQQELIENFDNLTEEKKRLAIRGEMISHNKSLAEAAKMAGISDPRDYAIFQNKGYKGLYGGLGVKEIHARKGLKKNQKIMCNTRGCPTIGSTLDLVERELIQALSDWVAGYQLDPTLEVENKVPEKEQLLSSAVSNHDLLLKQNGNLYDLLEQGVYTTEIFLERSHELQKRIKESEAHIEILKKDLEYEKEKIANIENFIPSCKELLSCYWDLSIQDRNKALKMLLESVEYTKTKRNRKGDKDNPTFTLNLKPRIPRI